MKISKVLLIFSVIFWSKAETNTINRRKRGNQDNFNILIKMYKMNPLKHSNVYKAFSNQVLLPRPEQLADLNLNTKESINEKQNGIDFKKYGEILDSKANKFDKGFNKNLGESFNSGNLENLLTFNQINFDEKSHDDADIFDDIFVSPKIDKRIKENVRDTADKTNTIDIDPNVYTLKKKHKHNKKRYHPNSDIILV